MLSARCSVLGFTVPGSQFTVRERVLRFRFSELGFVKGDAACLFAGCIFLAPSVRLMILSRAFQRPANVNVIPVHWHCLLHQPAPDDAE